ncbi:hypothetical protein, partial [Massilia glaciei]|uniref:hypothetical protein n=1 Tax=Massilia glaciei TaxID=1524097 RepID=UPI0015E81862
MRISIGHRLFASVLLAIVAVAAAAILLMRQNVVSSFAEYAVQIELDRLEQLSGALAGQYQAQRGWDFVPRSPARRAGWIGEELARLQAGRPAAPPRPPSPAAPPAPPAPQPAAAAA